MEIQIRLPEIPKRVSFRFRRNGRQRSRRVRVGILEAKFDEFCYERVMKMK